MRKILLLFFVILFCFHCKPEEVTSLTVASESLGQFPEEGADQSIKVTANKTWSITGLPAWIVATPSSGGAGEFDVKITVKERGLGETMEKYDDREATFNVVCSEIILPVKILQARFSEVTFVVKSHQFPRDGGSVEVEIKSSVDYDIQIPANATWFAKQDRATTKGLNSTTVTFTTTGKNTTFTPFKSLVTVRSKTTPANDVLTLEQLPTENFIQGGEGVVVTPDGVKTIAVTPVTTSLSVELRDNINYEVAVPVEDQSWIELIENPASSPAMKAVGKKTYSFKLEPNTEYIGRASQVFFKDPQEQIADTLRVSQKQVDHLQIDRLDYSVKSSENTFDILVNTNVNYSAIIPENIDWISAIAGNLLVDGLNETKMAVTVAKSNDPNQRVAEIVVSSLDGEFPHTIKITQAQADALSLVKRDFVVVSAKNSFEADVNTNVEYVATVLGADWVTAKAGALSQKGYQLTKTTVEVEENQSYAPRRAAIEITSLNGDLADTIRITQKQVDHLSIETLLYNVEAAQSAFDVTVNTNVDYTATTAEGVDWITATVGKVVEEGLNATKMAITVSKNPKTTAREGSIVVRSVQGDIVKTITIKQKASSGTDITIDGDFDKTSANKTSVNTIR